MTLDPNHVPRCSALLFDLDGTLVDSRRDIAEALNAALTAVGRARLTLEAVMPLIGDGARILVERALRKGGEADGPLVDRALAIFAERYAERPVVHTTLLPGAREALSLGLPAALVTNKPRAVTVLVLERLGIATAFGAIYAGGDGPLKPAPDGILAVTRQLDVAPNEAWMIGDGPQDVLAGRAAGSFTVAVPGIAERVRVLAAGPDLVVGSLEELAALVLQRSGTPKPKA